MCVATLGCSYPFEIADDVWKKAFIVSARGFYHQRSGIPLGEPFSAFKRPRPFHPDDGVKVFASKTPLIDTGNGLNQKDSNFGNLVKGKTDEIVSDAWGGYMDAGDWDRRIQHLRSSLLLLELAELFPEYFASLRLNIPESGNGLPDIVNEALFNLDFYRRMQTHEGGVRGGIESAEHPRRGEASSQESLTVMAYAPGRAIELLLCGCCRSRGAVARVPGPETGRWVPRERATRHAVGRERPRARSEGVPDGQTPSPAGCPQLCGGRVVLPHGGSAVERALPGDDPVHQPERRARRQLRQPRSAGFRVGLCANRAPRHGRHNPSKLP